ncbi:non-ribosomal peptide synthase [Burkholderia pseudomallei]|nr:non-ribosomal peptide synthase [Burkholderia pseudomallei]CAJ3878800.1 non-ribosomal peptide synthase [Burkholderia pseudomallei]CAJ4450434.1 non-ribosomal peptide synthase [Burkholderia pseudomallei]CAJ4711529.1 non-ribosomal peptide synthase [Burkholderia pseudomallei]CAJ5075780.1 non-ribosomal peptide synthase [Burkholderia pseudomallei]
MNNSLNITTGSSAGRPLSAQYRCATFARMNSKSTVASIWRSRWSFGTSSSSVTISSSCCVGMGVFSITPLKNKNPALGEGLSAIWGRSNRTAFFVWAWRRCVWVRRGRRGPVAVWVCQAIDCAAGDRVRRRSSPTRVSGEHDVRRQVPNGSRGRAARSRRLRALASAVCARSPSCPASGGPESRHARVAASAPPRAASAPYSVWRARRASRAIARATRDPSAASP